MQIAQHARQVQGEIPPRGKPANENGDEYHQGVVGEKEQNKESVVMETSMREYVSSPQRYHEHGGFQSISSNYTSTISCMIVVAAHGLQLLTANTMVTLSFIY